MKKIDYLIENITKEEVEKLKILETHYVLNEASFAKIVTTYFDTGFIIISADRSCEAEKGSVCSEKEILLQRQKNKENEVKIKQLIRAANISFLPTYGGYKEKVIDKDGNEKLIDSPKPEKSFIIPAIKVASNEKRNDYEALKELGVNLSQEFNQDAFLYKPPSSVDKSAYFITKDGNVDMTFHDVKPNDLGQTYFTSLRKMNPDRRFTMVEQLYFIPKSPYYTSEARKRYGEIFYRMIGQENLQIQKMYKEREERERLRKEKRENRNKQKEKK